jgi:hypothetical protein
LADVGADEVSTNLNGARITLCRNVLIVDSARRIAVLRVARDGALVEPLCSGDDLRVG